ncbi:MAG: hypothetical protein AAFV96_18275 [Pseudomonadota bacterium]
MSDDADKAALPLSATDPNEPRDFAGEGAARDFAGERVTVDPQGARALLDARLIAAHRAGDTRRLVSLYIEAAESSAARGDEDAAAFYRTHAYVFALQCGHEAADALHASLKEAGREE